MVPLLKVKGLGYRKGVEYQIDSEKNELQQDNREGYLHEDISEPKPHPCH